MTEENLSELLNRINKMEQRLSVLEEIEEIKKLHRKYENYHTFGDDWGRLSCYSEDAVLEVEGTIYKGKTAIAEHMRLTGEPVPFVDKKEPLPDGHFAVHPIIEIEGNKAKGSWLMYEMHSHPRTYQSLFWIQGVYDYEYVKENGTWKFSYMKWRPRIHTPGTPP